MALFGTGRSPAGSASREDVPSEGMQKQTGLGLSLLPALGRAQICRDSVREMFGLPGVLLAFSDTSSMGK